MIYEICEKGLDRNQKQSLNGKIRQLLFADLLSLLQLDHIKVAEVGSNHLIFDLLVIQVPKPLDLPESLRTKLQHHVIILLLSVVLHQSINVEIVRIYFLNKAIHLVVQLKRVKFMKVWTLINQT